MIVLLVKWAACAAALMVGASMMKTVRVKSWGAAFAGAAVFGIANALLGWLLTWIITILTLPVTVLTLGLFLLVIGTLVNMVLLKLADAATGDAVEIQSVGGLFGLALLVSLASWLVGVVM